MIKKILSVVLGLMLIESVSLATYSVDYKTVTTANTIETYTFPTADGFFSHVAVKFVNGSGKIYKANETSALGVNFYLATNEVFSDFSANRFVFKAGDSIRIGSPTANNSFEVFLVY